MWSAYALMLGGLGFSVVWDANRGLKQHSLSDDLRNPNQPAPNHQAKPVAEMW